jgi:CubicO group peptidase (beta-lactamase class C family)
MNKSNIARFFILLLMAITTSCTAPVKEEVSNDQSVRSPEAEGISSHAILDFLEAVDREMPDELHSIIIRRHGNVVARGWWAPYRAETPHMLYSLSKSFTSTAIGMAIDEGLISIDDPVISFFPDDLPGEPGENLKAMRIRDLLKMNTGHLREPGLEMRQGESWVKGFLAQEVQFKPGTHFVYNSSATYMLSAIIQKVTGMTLLDYLKPRLFEPLGIEHPTWETDPDGINTGGWGLSITTEDISRFGQLYLQKGAWNGKQLVSEEWVEEATTLQTSNGSNPESDWEQGYGYQFWRCRHDFYRGDGAFGQFCIVMPEQDAVLAITSGTGDMQKVMNLAWKHLLPGMKEGALPPDEEGAALLDQKLNELAISYVKGEKESSNVSDVFDGIYRITSEGSDISGVSFDFGTQPHVITFHSEKGKQNLKAGYGSWEAGSFVNPGFISSKVAVCGAWRTPDTYLVKMVYDETPYIEEFTFRFAERQLIWDRELNVSFGPTKTETLKGIPVD